MHVPLLLLLSRWIRALPYRPCGSQTRLIRHDTFHSLPALLSAGEEAEHLPEGKHASTAPVPAAPRRLLPMQQLRLRPAKAFTAATPGGS